VGVSHKSDSAQGPAESRIAMIERRALARHKTFIKGRIYFNNRLSSMDCIVRDITDRGARLEASESVALPDAFELYLPNKDEHFFARVEWRKGSHLGVSWSVEHGAKHRSEAGQSEQSIADRVAKLEHDLAVLQRRFESLQHR
jgi:PilZ domain